MKGWGKTSYAQHQLLASLLFDPWGMASKGKGKGNGKAKGKGHGKASSDRKGKGKGGEKGKGKVDTMLCHCCGHDNHLKKDCWHISKECANCGGTGHLSAMCNKPMKDKTQDATDDKKKEGEDKIQHVLSQTTTCTRDSARQRIARN